MNFQLRAGTLSDAQACGVICYEAFKSIAEKHNYPPDFPSPDAATGLMTMALSRPDIHSVVAEMNGRVVGSNFLWENSAIASVGPITIDPAAQNGQIGRALMENVLERARSQRFTSVRLVQAAYHGRSMALYTKLGFDICEPLVTLQGKPIAVSIPGYTVRRAGEADLDACNAVCMRVHGHERGQELLDAIRQGSANLVEHDGRITAYASSIGFFGHAVGDSNEELKALIGAADGFAGPGLLLPSRNGDLFRWCLQQGLKVVQPMSLMSLGLYKQPAGPFLSSVLY